MKAILEFNLPDDLDNFNIAYKASDLYFALYEFSNFLRAKIKHENLSDDEYEIYEKIRDILWETMSEHNVNFDMIS